MNDIQLIHKDYANELYHYGVKGMKWGVRRASRLQNKANVARASAEEWDELARNASSKGKLKKAAKYQANAADDRAAANRYQQKVNKKVESRYARAGRVAGTAQYERDKGAAALKSHENAAKRLDNMASKYDSSGKVARAELARSAAKLTRNRGANINAEQQRIADMYMKRSNHLNEKASSFANDTNVNLGKNKIDSILKNAKKEGYDSAKNWDDWEQESKKRDFLGDSGYSAYNFIKGK